MNTVANAQTSSTSTSTSKNVDFATALQRLQDGNGRFVQDLRSLASLTTSAQRAALAAGQSPFAVILSCADSRVPSEMVFDQGFGDLFVVRVAGNVVAPSLVHTPGAARASADPDVAAYVRQKQPLDGGRIARASDVDGAVVYLLSPESRFVTGQVLAVYGGWCVSEPHSRSAERPLS